MSAEVLLDLARAASFVDPSIGSKLLKRHERLLEDTLKRKFHIPYRLGARDRNYIANAYQIECSEFTTGNRSSNHAVSAFLRDEATNGLIKYLQKCLPTETETLRLHNPPLSLINRVLNEVPHFTCLQVYSGLAHHSDLKRSAFSLEGFQHKASRHIVVEHYDTEDLNSIFSITPYTSVVLTDDAYHVNPNSYMDFLMRPHNRVFATFHNLPAFLVTSGLASVTTSFGHQCYRDGKSYKHYLEDGTSYTGSVRHLAHLLTSKNNKPHANNLFVSKVFEPLNAWHSLLIMGATVHKREEPTELKIYNHLVLRTKTTAFIMTDFAFNRLRNFVFSSVVETLTVGKIWAYIRTCNEMKHLGYEVGQQIVFSLYQLFQSHHAESKVCINQQQWAASSLLSSVAASYMGRFRFKIAGLFNSQSFWYTTAEVFSDVALKHIEDITITPPTLVSAKVFEPADDDAPESANDSVETTKNPSFIEAMTEVSEVNPKFKNSDHHLISYIMAIQEQLSAVRRGMNNADKLTQLENVLNQTMKMSASPLIDFWVDGKAGSGKSSLYINLLNRQSLEDIVILSPTGDLVIEIQDKLKKKIPNFEEINHRFCQTYMKGLMHCANKDVVVDEAWLCPSFIILILSFLRSAGYIRSLTIVGDFEQNLHDESITPSQIWPQVISLVQASSVRVVRLLYTYRFGPKVCAFLRKACGIEIYAHKDAPDTDLRIIKNASTQDSTVFIGQSNRASERAARKGFKTYSCVTAQGSSYDSVVFEPTNNYYSSGFYVGLTRARQMTYVVVPSAPSQEMQEKINILAEIVDIPAATFRTVKIDGLDEEEMEEKTPEDLESSNESALQSEIPDPEYPENLQDLDQTAFDEVVKDISDPQKTMIPAMHSQENDALVKRSMAASFATNPELIEEDVDLNVVFPELKDFSFSFNEEEFGYYLDKYISKLPGENGLRNQILEDANQMSLTFKNQMKGGITFRNKQDNTKVGQIIRASSKYYQIMIGPLVNMFFAQLHDYLINQGVFSGCGGNDQDAKVFVSQIPASYNVITYDTVKNESRVGPITKKFEREFISHFSAGIITYEMILEHDEGLYVDIGGWRIDCSLMRNSGEIATLARNFIANYCAAKLRLKGVKCYYLCKGDNNAIFSSLPKSDLLIKFKPMAEAGTIEIDEAPTWTSYEILKSDGFKLVPNYSYIGERVCGNFLNDAKDIQQSEVLNYSVHFNHFVSDFDKFSSLRPDLFNDAAFKAYNTLKRAEAMLDDQKAQLSTTRKQKNRFIKSLKNAFDSKATTSSSKNASPTKGSGSN